MAIQTRQQVNGRTIGLWRMAGVTVGAIAMSAALVAGGLGWQRGSAPQAQSAGPLVGAQPVSLGIALPRGADIHELPAGISDYVRAGERQMIVAMEQHPFGIALPYGATAKDLPAGLDDYIQSDNDTYNVRFQATQLGINLPGGATMRELPTGLSDYVRPQPAAHAAAPSTLLGITLPAGAQRSDLPAGMADYLRANP